MTLLLNEKPVLACFFVRKKRGKRTQCTDINRDGSGNVAQNRHKIGFFENQRPKYANRFSSGQIKIFNKSSWPSQEYHELFSIVIVIITIAKNSVSQTLGFFSRTSEKSIKKNRTNRLSTVIELTFTGYACSIITFA